MASIGMKDRIVRSWLASGLRQRFADGRRPSDRALRLMVETTFAGDPQLAERARDVVAPFAGERAVCDVLMRQVEFGKPLARAAVGLMLTPAPSTPSSPHVAFVAWHDSGVFRADRQTWRLLDGALSYPDPHVRQDLWTLFTTTDQPTLLWSIQDKFRRECAFGADRPIAGLAAANPHLPTLSAGMDARVSLGLARGDAETLWATIAGQPVEAVRQLAMIAARSENAEWRATCQEMLRGLRSEESRQELCRLACHHPHVLRDIVRETGFRPGPDLPLPIFYFATEQWELYDEVDPDGTALVALCEREPHRYDRELHIEIENVALRTGRPNPYPPPPPPSSSSGQQRPPIGSWPTSFTGDTSGGFDGGGSHGGGFPGVHT